MLQEKWAGWYPNNNLICNMNVLLNALTMIDMAVNSVDIKCIHTNDL